MKGLLDLLGLPDNDYWYDVAACHGRSMIDDSGPPLFDDLLRDWRKMTDLQQEHLAYILLSGKSVGEDILIADMLKSDNKEVAFRAWEAQLEWSGEDDPPKP